MKKWVDRALSRQRLRGSFGYAFRGLKTFFLETPNALIHIVATIAVVAAAIILEVTKVEWAILILCMMVVLSLEACNTALEKLADRVSKEFSPLIRDAKDIAAGAVLIAAIGAAIVGLIIFLPYLF